MTFSKKNHSTPLHSTQLFKIFFSLLTLSTAFLQKASGPGKNNFNNISEIEKYIEIAMDVNRYAILIVIKKDWVLELDKNFMDLFGFEKNVFKEG